MYHVRKRNGDSVIFDLSKIQAAITKSFESCGRNYQDTIVEKLAMKAVARAEQRIKDNLLNVEDIQDSVESVLMSYGYEDVAKSYILYRKQHESARNACTTLIDYKKIVDDYTGMSDWRVKENSSISYSLGGLILSNSGAITANYWLSEIYDKEIADAHRNCDIHIHDLSMLNGYCFTGDTIVKALDGKNRTFEQLVNDNVKEMWVYSYDTDENKVVIAKAENPRVTRYTDELIEITLASRKKIKCTPDHPIMLRDGTYIEAQNLKPNMSVMPLNISEKGKYVEINKFWCSEQDRKNQYLHRWVAEQTIGRPIQDDEVVHHLNEDKHDNRPENLQVMLDKEHRAMEVKKTMETDLWKQNNNERLVNFNKSDAKRKSVSDFASSRKRDDLGRFTEFKYNANLDVEKKAYNHRVRSVKRVKLDAPIPVYDLTVPKYHNFAVGGNIFVHNCAGWSLKKLITEGFNGVPKKTSSAPAKHLSTLCNQMTNFLGCLQNEWSGAQAFNSVDTLLAPFVKYEDLSYKEVKQCIQSLVYNLNTSSRWGCVTEDTEVLTVDGFKKYDELKVGDLIYTWKDGTLEINDVKNVLVKEYSGKMHRYSGRGYDQIVTPEHKVLYKKFNKDEYVLSDSSSIFDSKTPYSLPVAFKNSALDASDLSDAEIMLAAIVYADGTFDMRKDSVHKVKIFKSQRRFGNELITQCANELGLEYTVDTKCRGFSKCLNEYTFYGDSARRIYNLTEGKKKVARRFCEMDARQSMLFLDTWLKFDGDTSRYMVQFDNDDIADALQHIAIRAGICTYIATIIKKANKKPSNYVSIRRVDNICPTHREEIEYSGIVWCPSVENRTAVFRKDGKLFISGQSQPVFSNFTFDLYVPDDLAELNCIVGGQEVDFKYKDCKREMDMINRAFMEVMLEGDADGKSFSYPIPTYSITKDFDWDEESINNKLLFEMTAKYGIPYFSNYVNSDLDPSSIRSMCCRLRLDLRELRRKNGGYFGSGDNTGSIGVVTINMPRLAYKSKDEKEFYKNLEHLMDLAARSLKIKRTVIEQYFEQGLYPYTKRYLASLNDHFSTIGLLGMNECCLNAKWINGDISSEEGYQFTKDVLDFMRNKLSDYQEKYGDLYNLEATPAEGTTYRFASHDKKDFPDIITAGDSTDGAPYYTNSSHLPVGYTDDIFTALDHQDDLQTKYTSGTVFHAFLGEKLPSWQSAMTLTRKIAENYKLPYFTFSPTYSICPEHGYIKGEEWTCPICGKTTEVYSRVTGYYRAVQNFNDGKAHEFKDRKEYVVNTDEIEDEPDFECESCKVEYMDSSDTDTTYSDQASSLETTKPMLFTTATCPNCKMAKKFISDAGFDCDNLLAEEHPELVKQYNINSAPTLVVFENGQPRNIQNVSNIRKFLDSINK